MAKWLENFWYHYKWRTLLALLLIVLLVVGIVSIVNKQNYDGNIMIVGNQFITKVMIEDINKSFKQLVNEKDIINFSQLYYDPTNQDNYQANEMARQTLATMAVQSYYLYIMSEDVYLMYRESGVFEKLTNVFEKIPDSAYDEYAIRLSDTSFAKHNAGVDNLSNDMVICLKVVPYTRTNSAKRTEQKAYDYHKDLLIKIVEY